MRFFKQAKKAKRDSSGLVICSHIVPCNSTRTDIHTEPDAFDILEDKVRQFKKKCLVAYFFLFTRRTELRH